MGTQIDSRIRHHWVAFDKKWEDKIVQLEPGSKEGAITITESRIWKSVQKEVEGVWIAWRGRKRSLRTVSEHYALRYALRVAEAERETE